MVDMNDVSRRMDASVSSLSNDFSGLRAGRASTAMLDPVSVDAYGSKMPLNQVSNISVPESRLLTVTVWDAGLTDVVEKAIRESGLGLNPQTEGNVIRIPVPDLSEERRKEMVKVAGKYAESGRVAIGTSAVMPSKPCARPKKKVACLKMNATVWKMMFRN